MLPVYSPESHSLYQDFLISNFLLYYPDSFSISRQTWKIIVQLRHKKKKTPKGKKLPNIKSTSAARFLDFYKKHPLPDPSFSPLSLIFRLYKQQFLDVSVSHGLIQPSAISLAGDDSPIRTSARLRYKKVCCCSENGISHCNCKRLFSQPDCNIGWDFIHKIRTAFYPSFLLYPQSP